MTSSYKLNVRFRDCDMLQHVNNAVYLTYFEEARIHYFRQLLGIQWDWKTNGILLRKNEVEYLKPVLLTEPVEIKLFLKHVGEKSFTLAYEVKVFDEIRTFGSSVIVCYNNSSKTTIKIPELMRTAINRLELKLEQ
jgi:acyl-CoA thioester hydrolase